MTEEMRSPEEQEYAALFEAVEAPPTLRRWSRPGEAAAAGRRLRPRRLGLLRFDLGGRVAPIAAAAAISLVVGGAGAAVGLHVRSTGGIAGATPGTPPARAGAAMAYDPADHVTLLFGGQGSSGRPLGDTWAWDGSAWAQLHPATSPAARSGAQMAWDAASSRMVLFGGMTWSAGGPQLGIACRSGVPCPSTKVGGPVADTWTWDGSNWRQEHPAHHPAYGFAHGMVDDPGSHQVVLVAEGPEQLLVGDGSAPLEVVPPVAPCAGKCVGSSCTSWTSTGSDGSVSGGGGCSGSAVPLTCPTFAAGVADNGASSSGCTSFAIPATSGSASGAPSCPSPPAALSGGYACSAISSGSATATAGPSTLPCVAPRASAPPNGCALVSPIIAAPTSATFGWNGSDWRLLAALPAQGSVHLVTDPLSGRPLAIAVEYQVRCLAAAGAAGAAGSGQQATWACEPCAANYSCPLPAGQPSVPVPAKPGTPARPPDVCPATNCGGSVVATGSLTAWRFDGSWHSAPVGGALAPLLAGPSHQLLAVIADPAHASLVAVVGSGGGGGVETWRLEGQHWSVVAGSNLPDLYGAALAADANGIVIFGGQGFKAAALSNATYTWDGHTWTRRGSAAAPTPAPATPVPSPPGIYPVESPQPASTSASTSSSASGASPAATSPSSPAPTPG